MKSMEEIIQMLNEIMQRLMTTSRMLNVFWILWGWLHGSEQMTNHKPNIQLSEY